MGDSVIKGMPVTPPATAPTAPAAIPAAATAAAPAPAAPERPADHVQTAGKTGSAATAVSLDAPPAKPAKQSPHPKGTFFASYGYNRAAYANSDIRFKGTGYDFTLHDASAQDKPSFGTPAEWFKEVLHTHVDVPQTNYKIGYFINDNTHIALSMDHMKYHMRPGQQVTVSGQVSPEASQEFAGTYDYDLKVVGKPGTIVSDLQHCDGLNNVFVELGKWKTLAQTNNGNLALDAYGTVGAGFVFTDTRANVFSRTADGEIDGGEHGHENPNGFLSEAGEHHHHTHGGFVIDGMGASAGAGLRATFMKHVYVEAGLKAGFDKLMGFRSYDDGRGYQNIGWLQSNLQVGLQYTIGNKAKQ